MGNGIVKGAGEPTNEPSVSVKRECLEDADQDTEDPIDSLLFPTIEAAWDLGNQYFEAIRPGHSLLSECIGLANEIFPALLALGKEFPWIGPLAGALLMCYESCQQLKSNMEDLSAVRSKLLDAMHWIEFIGQSINRAQMPMLKASFRSFCKCVVQVAWIVQHLHRRLGNRSRRSVGTRLHNFILSERDSQQLEEATSLLDASMAEFKASISAIVNWDAYLESRSLQRCLQPIPFDRQYEEYLRIGADGLDLQWLHDMVAHWLQSHELARPDRRVFWLRGGPGTGKSVFAAQLVDRIHGDRAAGTAACDVLAKLFCNACSPFDVVRSLAYQLAVQLPLVQEHIREAMRTAQLDSIADIPTLFQRLIAAPLTHAQPPGNVRSGLVVIDGLDGLSTVDLHARRELIGLFSAESGVLTALPAWMVVFITGRPDGDVSHALGPSQVNLNDGIHQDLLSYAVRSLIQRRLHQLRRTLRCRWSAHAMEAITTFIHRRSKRHLFYLRMLSDEACLEALAKLDVRVLRGCPSADPTVRDLMAALSCPRPSLDAAFFSYTTRLHLDEDSLHLLEVLLVAQEPLTVSLARCLLPHVDVHRSSFDLRRLFTIEPPEMVFQPIHRHLLSIVRRNESAVASGLSLERGHYLVAVALLRRTLRMHRSVSDFYDALNAKHSLEQIPWERMLATASAIERRLLRYCVRHAVGHLQHCDAARNFDLLAFRLLTSFQWLMLACDTDLLQSLVAQCEAMRRVYEANDGESGKAEVLCRLERVLTSLHCDVAKLSATQRLTAAQRRRAVCTKITSLVAVPPRGRVDDEGDRGLEALAAQARAFLDRHGGWVHHAPSPAAVGSDVGWSIASGGGEQVTAVASQDDVFLYGTDAGTVRVCVAATGDEVGALVGAHTAAVIVLAALSGQRVLSISRDGLVIVWDVVADVSGASLRERTPLDDGRTPACLAACACVRLRADANVDCAAAWTTAGGYRIAVGLRDGALWCLSLGLREVAASDAAASPLSRTASAAADGRSAVPWHVQLGNFVDWYGLEWQWSEVVAVTSAETTRGKAATMAVADEALIVAQGLSVAVYRDKDLLPTAPRATLSLQAALMASTECLDADASIAAVCSLGCCAAAAAAVAVDRFVCVVDAASATVLRVLPHHTTSILSMALVRPGLLVSVSAAHSMRLWSVGREDGDGSAVVTHLAVVRGHNSRFVAACGACDVLAVTATGEIRRVAVSAVARGSPCHSQWDVHVEWLFPLAHEPQLLCIAKRNTTLTLYDVVTGQALGVHRLEPGPFDAAAHMVALAVAGSPAVLLLDRHRLRLWRVDAQGRATVAAVLHPSSDRVLCICKTICDAERAVAPQLLSVFVGLDDGSIALWQLAPRGASGSVVCSEQRRWKQPGAPPILQLWLQSADEQAYRLVTHDAVGLHSLELLVGRSGDDPAASGTLVPRFSAVLCPDSRGGRELMAVATTSGRWLRLVSRESSDRDDDGPRQQLQEWGPWDGDGWHPCPWSPPADPSLSIVAIGCHETMPDSLLYRCSDGERDVGRGGHVAAYDRRCGEHRVLSLDDDDLSTWRWTTRTSVLLAPVVSPLHLGADINATCLVVLPPTGRARDGERWWMVVGDVDGNVHFLSKQRGRADQQSDRLDR